MADIDTLREFQRESARLLKELVDIGWSPIVLFSDGNCRNVMASASDAIISLLDENERLRDERDMWKGRAETSVDIARVLQGKEPKYGTITGAGPHL